ncbi:MAG: metallophosphoesterase [Ferruginibacter sp.]
MKKIYYFFNAIVFIMMGSILIITCKNAPAKKENEKAMGMIGAVQKPAAPAQPSFLFISDIHLESTQAVTRPFEHDDTGMDLWKNFLLKANAVLAQPNSPNFIIYTGDLPGHYGLGYLPAGAPRAAHDTNMVLVLDSLRQLATRNHKSLFYLPGNNDAVAGDYFPFGYGNNYTPFSLIDETKNPYPAVNINKGTTNPPYMISQPDTSMGYYSACPASGIRLIAMNTVVYTNSFFNACRGKYVNRDPLAYSDSQMVWLSAQLADAKRLGEKVYIAMHVPPGVNIHAKGSYDGNWVNEKSPTSNMNYNDWFLTIVDQYKDTCIEAILYGHTHMDELRRMYNSNDQVTAIGISCPGISPNYDNNPGFKTVTYDPASKSLLDFTTYYMSLKNSYWGNDTYTYSASFNKTSGSQSIFQQLSVMPLSTINTNMHKIFMVKNGYGSSNMQKGIEVKFTGGK